MAEKTPELVGKKKFVVDSDAFFSAPRNEDDELAEDLQTVINDAAYFNAPVSDKVRIVRGKNWDYREDASGKKAFSNNWSAPKVFQKDYLGLVSCSECPDEVNDGLNQKLEEKFVLKHEHPSDDIDKNFWGTRLASWTMYTKTGIIDDATGKTYEPIILTNKTFFDHYHESINPFTPADLDSKQPAGKAFFANYKTYYNERIDSSNFESATGYLKLPGTNAPYIQNALPSIYAFLRLFVNKDLVENSLFDFSALTSYDLKSFFDVDPNGPELKNIYKTLLKNFTLETLLTLYGIIGHQGSRDGLFGNLGKTKIIEKIVATSFDNIDADSLFSDYFNEYTKILTTLVGSAATDAIFWYEQGEISGMGPSVVQSAGGLSLENATTTTTAASSPALAEFVSGNQYRNRMRALERMMTNLVFSPNTIKLLNKVDQYKKYFPFYAEIEFTANLDTELGDAMKKMYLTKFMSELVLSSTKPPESDWWHDSWTAGFDPDGSGPLPPVYSIQQPSFFDYHEKKVYTDLGGQQVEAEEGSLLSGPKKAMDILTLMNHWTTTFAGYEGAYFGEQKEATNAEFSKSDLRNYMTFFRNDFSEPTNLDSDENIIFKKLFGSVFLAKILDIYKNKRRTYEEIMDGKPAYTEDLFYRIEKTRKIAGSDEEKVVQNILFPNTSELDIVKYVDTQLKYATYATYKYNIYVHRVVFGSKYKYEWFGDDGPIAATPAKRTIKTIIQPPVPGSTAATTEYMDADGPMGDQDGISGEKDDTDSKYSAVFNTVVEPSIVLLEDKIFSTPEILILDKPPVTPDINILPYRAVNNRLKILLTGASDRYRQEPVIIMDSDVAHFDRLKKAQLVVDNSGNPAIDGKIEFGSDDPVRKFQIFRTTEKPRSYRDFVLYQQFTGGFFEEQVLPNTRYYYTFRAIDDHGHISNPTSVYEVELIDEKGAVKPVIRLFDMTPPKNKINTKACQKYIYLKPSIQQMYFSDNPDVDSIFSDATNKKKYKLRLTSKGSGKKIDINFSFKKEIKN